jgi:hypothetical protein
MGMIAILRLAILAGPIFLQPGRRGIAVPMLACYNRCEGWPVLTQGEMAEAKAPPGRSAPGDEFDRCWCIVLRSRGIP